MFGVCLSYEQHKNTKVFEVPLHTALALALALEQKGESEWSTTPNSNSSVQWAAWGMKLRFVSEVCLISSGGAVSPLALES